MSESLKPGGFRCLPLLLVGIAGVVVPVGLLLALARPSAPTDISPSARTVALTGCASWVQSAVPLTQDASWPPATSPDVRINQDDREWLIFTTITMPNGARVAYECAGAVRNGQWFGRRLVVDGRVLADR